MFMSHHSTSRAVYPVVPIMCATRYESGDLVVFQMQDHGGRRVPHACNDQIGTVLRHDVDALCDTYAIRFANGLQVTAFPVELQLAPRLAGCSDTGRPGRWSEVAPTHRRSELEESDGANP